MITVQINDGRPIGYLSSEEFANKVGIAKATVRVWISRGKLSKVLKIGNDWWIGEDECYPQRKKRA